MSIPLKDLRRGVSETVDILLSASSAADRTDSPIACKSALDEYALEAAIAAAKERMCAAEDRALKIQYWREMCALIDQRTPHRVRFMERLRGLA